MCNAFLFLKILLQGMKMKTKGHPEATQKKSRSLCRQPTKKGNRNLPKNVKGLFSAGQPSTTLM